MTRKSHTILLLAVAALLLPTAGCGQSGPFSYVKVSGRVTFDDGKPLARGQLVFDPQSAPVGDAHPLMGVVSLNEDGTFGTPTSHKPGDGVVPGKHKITIQYATDDQGNSLVPREYTSAATTPLEVDTADSPFEIVIPRP